MDGQKSPEYRAITHDRHRLEVQLASHFEPIAEVLRDKELLTDYQCEAICGAGKDGPKQLITAVLLTIELRPVSTFFKVIQVMKDKGTPAFSSYIEATIEGKRKEIYRQELAQSGSVESQEWDVFISYYHETKTNAAVDEIAKSLEAKKLKVFVDRSALKPGAIWSAEMVGAIHKCRAFIAVLTKKYARSPLCHGELYEAEFHGKTTYAVKLEQDWESESGAKPVVDIVLKTQYTTWNEENLKKLVDTITAKLELLREEKKDDEENQDKVLESFKREIENRATLNQTVMQVILHGNAGVGKTSLIKVLAGDKVNEHEPSTPVMEEPKQIEISTIVVNGSKSILNWKYLKTLKEEAGFIVGQANYTRSVDTSPTKPNNKSGGRTSQKQEERSFESRNQPDEESQSQDIKLSETVTDSEAVQKAREVMEKLEGEPWTLYISDVGGQLEFQELIPALTSGPSLHFIVISAKFKLNEHFPIVYRKTHERDQDTQPYESHCSVKEGIIQQISTILSTGLNGHEPKIIFILTFYEGNLDKLKEINEELKELIRPLKSNAFVPAGEELLCHPIDNINPAEEDIRRIQETVERIGKDYKVGTDNYYKVQTPYSWLHFSIALREKKSPVLSYEECAKIGQQCGIPNKEGINEALEFLHSKVGTVRFFSNDQTLRDIVITKPRILFENVTRLLEETFTYEGGTTHHEEFQSKGIFKIEHALSRIITKSELFTEEKFLAFLEHQYIIARIEKDEFFMPCSLVHAAPIKNHLQDQVQGHPALLIAFSLTKQLYVPTTTQYVPRGVFGFMIAELLSHTEDPHLFLREDKIFQNQVTFFFGSYRDEFRLSSFPSYIKIDVYESAPMEDREEELLLSKICCDFRQRIEASLKMVLTKFNYTKNADPVLAFFCTKCDRPHPAHYNIMFNSKKLSITCSVHGWIRLPPRYQVWFGKPESDSKTFSPDIDQTDRRKIAQISMEITNEKQHFTWDGNGLQLSIPENSLPTGVEKCVLHLAVYFSCPYEIPPNHKLVSAIYSIDCNPEVKFKRELTLEIQHCANSIELYFARAVNLSKSVDVLENSIFGDSHSGSIQLKEFGCYMIIQKQLKSDPAYCCVLPFYKVKQIHEVIIKIAVCENLDPLISEIKQRLEKSDQFCYKEPSVVVCVDTEIELLVDSKDENEQRSWTVKPLIRPMKLEKEEIVRWSGKYGKIPAFDLEASSSESQVSDLSTELTLNCKTPKKFTLKINVQESASSRGGLSNSRDIRYHSAWEHWYLDKLKDKEITGHGVKIAILDTGINPGHECFKENTDMDEEMDVDSTEQSAPVNLRLKTTGKILGGIDYTDGNENSCLDEDQHSHGTSVAGVAASNCIYARIGASSIVRQSRVGVAPGASLVIFRVSHSSGSAYSPSPVFKSLTSIFNYNANESDPMNRIRIVVMPFKLDGELDRTIEKTIKDLKGQGVICVAAAGNEGCNEAPPYPALHEDVLAVGSVNAYNRESEFTPSHDAVDLLALGEDVVVPVNDITNISYKDGTSLAAPAVGGLIALLLQTAVKYGSDGTAMKKITNSRTLCSFFQKYMTHDKDKKALESAKVMKFFNNISDKAICFDEVIKNL